MTGQSHLPVLLVLVLVLVNLFILIVLHGGLATSTSRWHVAAVRPKAVSLTCLSRAATLSCVVYVQRARARTHRITQLKPTWRDPRC